MNITAMKQALEALEAGDWYIGQLEPFVYSPDDTGTHEERAKVQAAITALHAAIADAEKPAMRPATRDEKIVNPGVYEVPAAQRQPLTDEQIWQIANDCTIAHDLHADKFARAIEAAHGITSD